MDGHCRILAMELPFSGCADLHNRIGDLCFYRECKDSNLYIRPNRIRLMSDPVEPVRSQRVEPVALAQPCVLTLTLGVSVAAFLMGSFVTEFRWFPYSQFLQPSYTAARALHSQMATTSSLRETDMWRTARFEDRGVRWHDQDQCYAGYTLYTSGHDSAAFLIDMDGRLVHRWKAPFHSLWSQPPHIDRAVREPYIHWRRAHLFPNGDLIAMYEAAGDTPWGYGLVKVDRDSNIIWKVADHIHHDLCVRPDGSIVTLSHEWRDAIAHPVQELPHLGRVLLDDYVVVLSPDGKVLRRISLLDAISKSDYANLLANVPEDEWDLLHTNTVELVTAEFAAHHDFAKEGQIMISLRSRHALAILDLELQKIVWASRGPYRSQHDPDLLPNGRILLFDNRGHAGPEGPSRILEFDPVSQAVHWQYAGSKSAPLNSFVRSVQQLLPNGNVLITESDGGRILEVTQDQQIVWEFRNPVSLPDDPKSVAIVCGATRLPADALHFEFRTPTSIPETQ